MQTQKIYDKLMKQQLTLGLAEGLRDAILQTCATRSLRLSAAQRAKLAAQTDTTVLLAWHGRALTAARVSEIFAAG